MLISLLSCLLLVLDRCWFYLYCFHMCFFLGFFIICICLLITIYSSCLPLFLVFVSCHVVDLALQSIAMISPSIFACCRIVSTLVRFCSMEFCMLKYMLANMNAVLLLVTCSVIVSSSESCDISVAYTFRFVIITDVLLLASPAVNI